MAAESKLSIKQVAGLVSAAVAVSGAGGAYTVYSQDAVQDERIEANAKAIDELKVAVAAVQKTANTVETTIVSVERDVDEIKSDTKEVRRLLDRLIGEQNGRRPR